MLLEDRPLLRPGSIMRNSPSPTRCAAFWAYRRKPSLACRIFPAPSVAANV